MNLCDYDHFLNLVQPLVVTINGNEVQMQDLMEG